mgnify:CR=1 FL=1
MKPSTSTLSTLSMSVLRRATLVSLAPRTQRGPSAILESVTASWFRTVSGNVHNRGAEYEQFKDQLAKHLLDILYESVPQVRGKVEYWTLGTPLTEDTYLASFCGGSYGTKCDTNMFAELNHKWTTTPHTSIPGLYLAGSDAFLPAVCGAMYAGILGASAILGYVGSLRMLVAFWESLRLRFRNRIRRWVVQEHTLLPSNISLPNMSPTKKYFRWILKELTCDTKDDTRILNFVQHHTAWPSRISL